MDHLRELRLPKKSLWQGHRSWFSEICSGQDLKQYRDGKGEVDEYLFFQYITANTNTIKYNLTRYPELKYKPGGLEAFSMLFRILLPKNKWNCVMVMAWALSSIYSNIIRIHYTVGYPVCMLLTNKWQWVMHLLKVRRSGGKERQFKNSYLSPYLKAVFLYETFFIQVPHPKFDF